METNYLKPIEPELELDPEPKINNFGSASQSLLYTNLFYIIFIRDFLCGFKKAGGKAL